MASKISESCSNALVYQPASKARSIKYTSQDILAKRMGNLTRVSVHGLPEQRRLVIQKCLVAISECGARPVSRSNSCQLLRVKSGRTADIVYLTMMAYQAAQYRPLHQSEWVYDHAVLPPMDGLNTT